MLLVKTSRAMGGRVGRTEGTKFQNFISKRKIRHSFAGGAVFEASKKKISSLILPERHQL